MKKNRFRESVMPQKYPHLGRTGSFSERQRVGGTGMDDRVKKGTSAAKGGRSENMVRKRNGEGGDHGVKAEEAAVVTFPETQGRTAVMKNMQRRGGLKDGKQ